MKVMVANNMEPFVRGGAELLADNLVLHLREAGHEAELLRIPLSYRDWRTIPAQMVAARNFELANVDRLIALKFPAYLLRHEQKVVWLLHQYRQAYDLFDAGASDVPATPLGAEFRSIVATADSEALSEARAVFTNSSVTSQRLSRYNGLSSTVLPPPLNDPERFRGGDPAGYIFAGGRVNEMKRQSLLIQALAKTPSSVRLIIAGPPDSASTARELEALAVRLGVQDRVRLDLRFLTRDEVAELVNHATACAYIPVDEDSMGYVAMEAAQARKPIISCSDSGGILELARHAQTGWVCEPSASSLADAMTEATQRAPLSRKRGVAAYELWTSLDLSWEHTIQRLLA